jgi:cell division protein FtsI/penicillin-binding protein 2
LSTFGGKVPVPSSDADRAAASIGQDNIVVSPLDMAMVAATVDTGSLHLPYVVAGSQDAAAAPQPIDQGVDSALRAMMTAVVTTPNGTAAHAGLPPGTAGKTGTAEYGAAIPPQTHAWFMGYRGDVAFAVLVVGGGVGGQVAAPIAAKFLNSIGSR